MHHPPGHQRIDFHHISGLYGTYAEDLARVREQQRRLLVHPTSVRAHLDDIEAEITYLLLRETRPETVVEIGAFRGWSTTWILQALRVLTCSCPDRAGLVQASRADSSLSCRPCHGVVLLMRWYAARLPE